MNKIYISYLVVRLTGPVLHRPAILMKVVRDIRLCRCFCSQNVGSGGLSSWNVDTVPSDGEEGGVSGQTKILSKKRKRNRGKKARVPQNQSDSEEEETVTLENPG